LTRTTIAAAADPGFICCMSLFIVAVDNTIVNTSRCRHPRRLHRLGLAGCQWTIDVLQLVLVQPC